MPFKSSKAFEVGKLAESQVTRKTILGQTPGGGGGTAASSIPPLTATGGTETVILASDGKYYKTHVFTSTGANNFEVTASSPRSSVNAELIGAGGRGSGTWDECRGGNAGGNGGFGIFVDFPVALPGTYVCNVGAQPSGPTSFSRTFTPSEPNPGLFSVSADGGGAAPGGIGSPPGGVGGVTISPVASGKVKVFGGTLAGPTGVFANYGPNSFLYPTPLQPIGAGAPGPGGYCSPNGPTSNGLPGTPGAARIYYEVPAPG